MSYNQWSYEGAIFQPLRPAKVRSVIPWAIQPAPWEELQSKGGKRHSLLNWVVVVLMLAGIVGGWSNTGNLFKGAAPGFAGVWEATSSVVEIENTCGLQGPFDILDSAVFPVEVKGSEPAFDVISGGVVAAAAVVLSSQSFEVDIPIEVQLFADGIFSMAQQHLVFSDVSDSKARFVLSTVLRNRSDGSPDCQIKLGGIAMRLGAVRPE